MSLAILTGTNTADLVTVVDAHGAKVTVQQIEQIKLPTRAVWVFGYHEGVRVVDTMIGGAAFSIGPARCLSVRTSDPELDRALTLPGLQLCWLELNGIPIPAPSPPVAGRDRGSGPPYDATNRSVGLASAAVGGLILLLALLG